MNCRSKIFGVVSDSRIHGHVLGLYRQKWKIQLVRTRALSRLGDLNGTAFKNHTDKMSVPHLHEVVFDFINDALLVRLVLHRERLAQLLEHPTLLASQLAGNAHVDMDEQVAAAGGLQSGNAQIPKTNSRSALRSLRNFHGLQSIE